MNTMKWFDRKFVFNHTIEEYPAIHARIIAAPKILEEILSAATEERLTEKTEGKWSVKDHIGHLSILEPLWRARILDIKTGRPELTPTDLDNNATTLAGFNDYSMQALVEKFAHERNETIILLSKIDPVSVHTKSMHPRMRQQLSLTDHLYFVAEHDDHHINYIKWFAGNHPH